MFGKFELILMNLTLQKLNHKQDRKQNGKNHLLIHYLMLRLNNSEWKKNYY